MPLIHHFSWLYEVKLILQCSPTSLSTLPGLFYYIHPGENTGRYSCDLRLGLRAMEYKSIVCEAWTLCPVMRRHGIQCNIGSTVGICYGPRFTTIHLLWSSCMWLEDTRGKTQTSARESGIRIPTELALTITPIPFETLTENFVKIYHRLCLTGSLPNVFRNRRLSLRGQ